jgi:hypothetical protein
MRWCCADFERHLGRFDVDGLRVDYHCHQPPPFKVFWLRRRDSADRPTISNCLWCGADLAAFPTSDFPLFVRDNTGQLIKQPERSNLRIQFLEPWEDFVPGQADEFLLELRRELSPSHPLYGLKLLPLGHSGAADDVLFETEDGRIVQVHLTLSQRAEQPPWPRHGIYSNADEWVQQVMVPAHEEYLH